ncbi:MAG: hypothetical protein K8S54_01745 [Spirochaetia bacterium]|nr:hypothetical protein [Spirochaetia bacterium]
MTEMPGPSESILLADPDKESLRKLAEFLRQNGFAVTEACGAPEAIGSLAGGQLFDLILTEAAFPGLSVPAFIEALNIWIRDSAVIFLTKSANTNHQISARPENLSEWIRRPVAATVLLGRIKQILDLRRELSEARRIESLDRRRFVNQLDRMIWKRGFESRRLIEYGISLVSNLRHAISQGRGVGALVSQVEFLQMLPADDRGIRQIPQEFIGALAEDARAVRDWLNSIERFTRIDKDRYELETVNATDLSDCILNAAAAVEKFRCISNQTLTIEPIPDATPEFAILTSRKAIELAIRELLTNAYKYSPPRSIVNIAWFVSNAWLSISILSDQIAELPADWVRSAFVPFAKLSNILNDQFLDEELSLGIGLPVIQEALEQVGGSVALNSIIDHSAAQPNRKRVLAEIVLRRNSLGERKDEGSI